jgi:hypothetical protein
LMPSYSAHLISMDPLLSYINRCTAHYSSVTFWIWFCLDLIKVIALAHLAIISTAALKAWDRCYDLKENIFCKNLAKKFEVFYLCLPSYVISNFLFINQDGARTHDNLTLTYWV